MADFSEIVGGIQKTPERRPVKLHRPYLTVRNVRRGYLDLSSVERFEVRRGELERLRLRDGDILIVDGNGSLNLIGRNALFVDDGQEWIHQNHIIRVRLSRDTFSSEFVSWFLNSPLGRLQMVEKAKTTSGLYTLSAGKVGTLEVPAPSLSEQQRIIGTLRAQMAEVERLAKIFGEELGTFNALPGALLREVFSGRF